MKNNKEPNDLNATMSKTKPRVALDMYVLAQGIRTGVYRVCDELFPRLARSPRLDVRLFYRPADEQRAAAYVQQRQLAAVPHVDVDSAPSAGADILLSPFGVAPQAWLLHPDVLQAHIIYDLIAINRPEYFSKEAADEVHRIVDSLDPDTVVFAISEFTRQELLIRRPDLSPRQIQVIPLAANASFAPCEDEGRKLEVRRTYKIPPGVPFVLSLATLEIRKNLDQVVNAFVAYLEGQLESPMHLVLSGMSGWKLEQLQAAMAAAGRWKSRIVLTGFVDEDDLSALYSSALCFVYLSRYEGFGLPPLEAMACGTPVICADNSSLPEVVGNAGLMFDADDVAGVAAAIGRIADSPDYRRELAMAGATRAALFSWERTAGIVIDTLCVAAERHALRPSNPRPRTLAPGALATEYGGPGRLMTAGFLDYQNGSVGPIFPAQEIDPTAPAGTGPAWPQWLDALPLPAPKMRVEGGKRTRGIFKSGTAEMPLVSYITVVRNNTATLSRTIDSVKRQTYANVEHIVLDGASTDGTLALIRQYDEQLDYFASEPDEGLYQAINKAIPLARGQLICVVNSDDWLEPEAAEIAVHRMRNMPGAAILLTAAHVQANTISHAWNPSFVHPGCFFTCANDCHNGIYANRAAYEMSGPYDTSYKIVADFKWIMRCMESGMGFVYTRERTVNYSLGGTSGDVRQHSIECMRVVSERFPFLSTEEVGGLYHAFFQLAGPVAAQQGDRPASLTDFVRKTFMRHGAHADFVNALTWASMAYLQHPADAGTSASSAAGPRPVPTFNRAAKDLVKSLLHKQPGLYRLGIRAYQRLRK